MSVLVYSNLLVGAIAVSFVAGTYALLGEVPDGRVLVLAFLGTFAVYQVERGLLKGPEDALNHAARFAWMQKHRGYVLWSVAGSALAGLALLPGLRPATWLVMGGLAIVSMLYMVPLWHGGPRLKSVAVLKPVTIALAWALGGILLPVVETRGAVTAPVLWLAAARFGFVLPNALLADWPDRAGDAHAGLQTVAIRLSEPTLRALATWILLGTLVAHGVALQGLEVPPAGYIDLGGPLALLVLVRWQPWPSSRWFFIFWLDLVIAWPLVTALVLWGTSGNGLSL